MFVDQWLIHMEAKSQGSVALSSGEAELYALGSCVSDVVFAQAIFGEIGLKFGATVKADSSTARSVAQKQGASRKMKHVAARFLFVQDLTRRKLLKLFLGWWWGGVGTYMGEPSGH